MDIKPSDKTIKELLGSKKQFNIPRFQREYSWEKKNYQEFFNDMLNCLQIENGTISPTQYFLGTMLFIGNYDNDKEDLIQVVDGQQRLTTITILFSALSDIFISINEKKLSDKIFEYIMTEDDNGENVKIIKTITSYPFFSYFIQDKEKSIVPSSSISEEEKCIKNCYDYFYKNLSEKKIRNTLANKYGNNNVEDLNYIDILKAIRDQVLQTTFISISTHDKNQANIIFEILNAKGKSLTYVDLIKNKIFEVLDEVEPADFAEEQWKDIKTILRGKEREESIGLATFYRHFWLSRYKKSTSKKMYDDFLKQFKSKNKVLYKNLLLDMKKDATNYMKLVNPSRSDYDNRKEYFWLIQSLNVLNNYFNVTQVRVVLLALYDLKEKGLISMKEFKRLIIFLENFHFAYNAIMGGNPNRIENIYSAFSITVRELDTKTAVNNLIQSELIQKLSDLMPKFNEFSIKFCELEYSKMENKSNLKTKYVVNKLNSFYEQNELFDDNGTIEHIISESTNQETLNIGNLILLEPKINNLADNKTYLEKRKVYNQSSYKWIVQFLSKNPSFEINDIKARALKLAEIYYVNILNGKIDKIKEDKQEKKPSFV